MQGNAAPFHQAPPWDLGPPQHTIYYTVYPQLQAGLDIYIEHTVSQVSQQRGIGMEQSCRLLGTQRTPDTETHQIIYH